MKDAVKKYWAVALMFLTVTAVCLLFSCRKSGMFIDEIYTYGLSNSSYAPYITDIKGGSALGQVITRQELFDYVAVTEGEGFDFGSVYYNQAMDVHPPLYYWLFNAVSSLFPNTFSKWTGLALDYVIYMLALVCLYRLVKTLLGSRDIACAAVILYGLSLLGLSTMLMIRMYVLLTMLSLLLAWLIVLRFPEPLMRVFTSDLALIEAGREALHIYFFGFFFMSFQFAGQSVFQSLGMARYAVFYSLLRKAIIVVPLTLLLPRLGLGTAGVFLAEPISNLLGGLACFTTMFFTVYRRLGTDPDRLTAGG